ncbi:hypothetical protein [Salinibacterium sp. M195]|nr:hypothetical protein [Salinibacterium sp. M195]
MNDSLEPKDPVDKSTRAIVLDKNYRPASMGSAPHRRRSVAKIDSDN